MPTEDFCNYLDQAVEAGIQSFDGCGFGDSFMDPEYKDKLMYVKEKYPFVKTYVSTTGHLIKSKDFEWLCKCFDTIRFSHYGFSKEVIEKVHRGSIKYEKTKATIEAFLRIPRETRPHVIVQFLILKENEHQVEDWKRHWEPLADEIMIWVPHNFGDSVYADVLEEMKKNEDMGQKKQTQNKPNFFRQKNAY